MSQRFDIYEPGNSWLHRLDPRAKVWGLVLSGLLGVLFRQIGVLAGLLILTHLILFSARIPARRLGWLWSRLIPLLAMILILQPLFVPGPGPDLFRLGPIRITTAGILLGISYALRAATLAFMAAVLLLTTEPARLVQGLVKVGLPYPWGLTVSLAIHYLPATYGMFVSISEAQQARGWIVGQGNLLQRARSYLPILVATIIATLRLSDNLGLALAARGLGYPAQRTTLHDIHFTLTDWVAVVLFTAIFAVLMVWRFGLGFGAEPW